MDIDLKSYAKLLMAGAVEAFRKGASKELLAKSERHFPQFVAQRLDEGGVFWIGVASAMQAEWFGDLYAGALLAALKSVGGNVKEVKFEVVEGVEAPPMPQNAPVQTVEREREEVREVRREAPPARSTTAAHLKLREENAPSLHELYTFENFVEGPSNSYACAAAKAVAKHPGRRGEYNPLFIWGGTGLGKTHLMEAIAHRVWKERKGAAICCISTEEFLNQYVNALINHEMPKFRDKFRKVDLLLLDDVQFGVDKENFQEEFFNTFQQLTLLKKQIVVTCDVKPALLKGFQSRLISRFEGGMVVEIESPSFETRLAILRYKARQYPFMVPDEVLKFIATNIHSHVRAMEGALGKVAFFIEQNPTMALNLEMTKRLLKNNMEEEEAAINLSLDDIVKKTADHYRLSPLDVKAGGRAQMLVTARHLAMWLARKLTQLSLESIGTFFGKNHSTVHHGIQAIQMRMDVEKPLREDAYAIAVNLGRKIDELIN